MQIDIVFDSPPGLESCRFVEVESPPGTSISFGEWVLRKDGYWVLRFEAETAAEAFNKGVQWSRRIIAPEKIRSEVYTTTVYNCARWIKGLKGDWPTGAGDSDEWTLDDVADELLRALATQPPPSSGLQPIETAPRYYRYYIQLWGPSGYGTTPLRCQVGCWGGEYRPGRWITFDDSDFTDDGPPPTHWTPLPAA